VRPAYTAVTDKVARDSK